MASVYLTRRAHFCASHRLHSEKLSDNDNIKLFGKCNNPNGHGHNYVVEVTVKGGVNPVTGIVLNIDDLKDAINQTVMKEMDHKHLNLDVPAFKNLNPTAENIAIVIWQMLNKRLPAGFLNEVKLHETENNVVVYKGEKN